MPASIKIFLANGLGLMLAIFVTGLIVDRLGLGGGSDAFFLARRVVMGLVDVINQAAVLILVPILVARFAGRRAGLRDVVHQFGLHLALWVGLSLLALWVFTPWIVGVLATGSTAQVRVEAAALMRLMGLSIPLAILFTVASAMLNIGGSFGVPALLRQLPRIAVFAVFALGLSETLARDAAAAIVLANLTLLLVAVWALARAPVQFDPYASAGQRPRGQVWPILFVGLSALAATMIETAYANGFGAGQLTLLELTQRLGAFVGNTLSLALVTPLLVGWTARSAERTTDAFGRALWSGVAILAVLQLGIFAVLPAALGLIYGSGLDETARTTLLSHTYLILVTPLSVLLFRLALVWRLSERSGHIRGPILFAVACDVLIRLTVPWLFGGALGLGAVILGMVIAPLVSFAILMRGQGAVLRTLTEITPDRQRWLILVLVSAVAVALSHLVFGLGFAGRPDWAAFVGGGLIAGLPAVFLMWRWSLWRML